MTSKFFDWRRVRAEYPHNLTIDIHSHCNAKCVICPYPRLKNELPMGRMDPALFTRLIDEFAQIKREHDVRGHVVFCNMGEMFMDPDVLAKIKYVRDSGLHMVIQTNASLLTPEKADQLVADGYRGTVYVSFHGARRDVYERITGLNDDQTLANVKHLIGLPLTTLIRAYVHRWPVGEARRVLRLWEGLGLDRRNVGFHIPNNRTGLVDEITRASLKYPGKWLRGCRKGLPLRDMVISWNGQAVLCCEDMGRQAVLGDVSQSSILEVWNSPRAHELMDYLWGGAYGRQDNFICRRCEFGQSNQLRRLVKNIDNSWNRFKSLTF